MDIIRRIDVPLYIYSGRLGEDLCADFEDQFFRRVQYYDDALMAKPNAQQMGLRIGLTYFRELGELLKNRQAVNQHPNLPWIQLGDEAYAWRVVEGSLNENSVVYCFGAGTNITFEEELTQTFGARVHVFDPTRQAAAFVATRCAQNPLLVQHELGLSDKDGVIRFYHNPTEGLGSLSAKNLGFGTEYDEFEVAKLDTIARKNGHDRIDLLKIDIEGSEIDAIADLPRHGLEIDQICVEFDQPTPPWTSGKAIETLSSLGYFPISVWGVNVHFAHRRLFDF